MVSRPMVLPLPSTLRDLRALAAAAVSTNVKGQCATTCIWLHLLPQHDPAVKMLLEQIKMWFWLLGQTDPRLIEKAWIKAKADLASSSYNWNMVKGPLGATIGTLRETGWNPISPYKWVDPNGQEWQLKPGGSLTQLYYEFKEFLHLEIWRRASNFHNGKGLDTGISP